MRRTLDDARDRGLAVLPLCPFVKGWIERHPEYADLVRYTPKDAADPGTRTPGGRATDGPEPDGGGE